MIVEVLMENEIIYNKDIHDGMDDETKQYIKKHQNSKDVRIYRNKVDGSVYSQCNNKNDEYTFFHDDSDTFLSGESGLQLVTSQINQQVNGKNKFWHSTENIIQNNEFIISAYDNDILNELNNKSCILLNTNKHIDNINYNELISDYVVVMDNFYETDLFNCVANIVCVTEKTDVNDIRFKSYIKKHNPLIIVEPSTITTNIQWFLNKYNKRIIYVHTRYHGNNCTLSRMLVMFILCGLRDIYYVGFTYNDDDYVFRSKNIVILYDYIFNTLMRIYSNIRLYNLAEELDGDMSSGITSKYMKLNENIKKII
jgi:hypothetical protein